MNIVLNLAISFLVLCLAKPCAAEQNASNKSLPNSSLIAIVDVQYILDNSLAIKDLRSKIESVTNDLHAKMTEKEVELKKDEENLASRRGKISLAESEKETANFNKKVSEAQKYAQQQKIRLEKANSEGILQIHNATIAIIKEVCQSRKCNIVLPSSQLLYADSDLNITLEVLQKLNDKITTIKLNF